MAKVRRSNSGTPISKLMGHSSPTESGVYLHVLPGRQQEAVDCLDEEEQPTSEQEDENKEDES